MKLLLFLLLPITASAQSITVGYSVPAWGNTEKMIEFAFDYNDVSVHYFHSLDNTPYFTDHKSRIVRAGYSINTFAISYTPVKYKFIYSGIIVSSNKFPVEHGSKLNFVIGADFSVKRFTFSYKHISNGFGIQNPINIGADFIVLKINLH